MLRTERLKLRRWTEADREPFAALNADPEVMRFLPKHLTRGESDDLILRIEAHFERYGFGLFAAELEQSMELIGFVGLSVPRFESSFTPGVEIGWRVARGHWGKGYATEAAREVLRWAFDSLSLEEVVSFTVPANRPSWRVMERLGMQRDPGGDFDHPALPEGHPLRRHVLYRIRKAEFLGTT